MVPPSPLILGRRALAWLVAERPGAPADGRKAAPGADRAATAAPGRAVKPGPARAAAPRPIIVLDAGHGGQDPGAISVSGVPEKHYALAVVKAVQRQLEATGQWRVVLTRQGDVFLPLAERIRIARA